MTRTERSRDAGVESADEEGRAPDAAGSTGSDAAERADRDAAERVDTDAAERADSEAGAAEDAGLEAAERADPEATERRDPAARERRGTVAPDLPTASRRAVLRAGGAAALVGVAGTSGAAAADAGDGPVDVAVAEPYYASIGSRLAGADVGTSVRVGRATDVASDRAALHVSGAPVRSATDGAGAAAADLTLVDAVGSLATPAGEWREPLRAAAVRSRAAAERPVESWCECETTPDPDGTTAAGRVGERTAGAVAPRVLVFGTRSYQYAAGRGGPAHYEVAAKQLDPATRPASAGDDGVRVARLAHVHVDDVAASDAVEPVLDALRRATVSPRDVATAWPPAHLADR